MIVRNRSWPAVSHICNLIRFPSSSIVLILKSMLKNKNKIIQWHQSHLTTTTDRDKRIKRNQILHDCTKETYPMVVIKLVVKDPSEKRNKRQLLPTPTNMNNSIIRSKILSTCLVSGWVCHNHILISWKLRSMDFENSEWCQT